MEFWPPANNQRKPLDSTTKEAYKQSNNTSQTLPILHTQADELLALPTLIADEPIQQHITNLTKDIIKHMTDTHDAIQPPTNEKEQQSKHKGAKRIRPIIQENLIQKTLIQKRLKLMEQLNAKTTTHTHRDKIWEELEHITEQMKTTDKANELSYIKSIMKPLAIAAETNDMNTIWKAINKITKEKNSIHPSLFLDQKGTIINTPENILELHASHLARVTHSKDKEGIEQKAKLTPNEKKEINQKQTEFHSLFDQIQALGPTSDTPPSHHTPGSRHCDDCQKDTCWENLLTSSFAQHEWNHLLTRISDKAKSSVGPTEEAYPMITHGGEILHSLLLKLFNIFWKFTYTPAILQQSYIIPLYKKGDHSDPTNYRPITLSCVLLKLYEFLMEARIIKILEANGMLSKLQNATKKGRGAIDQIIDMLELGLDLKEMYMFAFDLSKAFDRTPRKSLFAKLHKIGISKRLWMAVVSTYTNASYQVKIGKMTSNTKEFTNGIKQGSVLSSLLFVIFVNDLLQKLETSKE
jgi:hypothetical protein